MYPKPIQKLIDHFQKLPGIGPKQGAKFAFRVLSMSEEEADLFAHDLKNVKTEIAQCRQCRLSYQKDGGPLCPICRDPSRDQKLVCVVETDRDAWTIEAVRAFGGVYHVLGERVSLSANSLSPALTKPLENRVKKLPPGAEVVLAMNATAEGQMAALWLERALEPIKKKITRLGRGFSSGIEIEYADRDTLVDAFKNRR